MQIVLFDTETTGLMKPADSPLDNQPRILEFGAIKLHYNYDTEEFVEVGRIEFMCDPGFGVPAIITKITGIKQEDIDGKPEFGVHYPILADWMVGTTMLVAHNLAFDCGMLNTELRHIGRVHHFPYPPTQICTVEASYHIKNRRMKLEQLYKHYKGKDPQQTHRAIGDVEILVECFKELVLEGAIEL